MIEIRASQLIKSRKKLSSLAKSQFPIHELLLGIATTALGAFLGGLISNMSPVDIRGIITIIICPIVAAGSFVGYVYQRKLDMVKPLDIANEILSELPDPENTSVKEVR